MCVRARARARVCVCVCVCVCECEGPYVRLACAHVRAHVCCLDTKVAFRMKNRNERKAEEKSRSSSREDEAGTVKHFELSDPKSRNKTPGQ